MSPRFLGCCRFCLTLCRATSRGDPAHHGSPFFTVGDSSHRPASHLSKRLLGFPWLLRSTARSITCCRRAVGTRIALRSFT
jgi:hypothetical protein